MRRIDITGNSGFLMHHVAGLELPRPSTLATPLGGMDLVNGHGARQQMGGAYQLDQPEGWRRNLIRQWPAPGHTLTGP